MCPFSSRPLSACPKGFRYVLISAAQVHLPKRPNTLALSPDATKGVSASYPKWAQNAEAPKTPVQLRLLGVIKLRDVGT
jgi:hypothetical protein